MDRLGSDDDGARLVEPDVFPRSGWRLRHHVGADRQLGSEGRFKANEAYIALWEKFRFSTDLAERKKAYAELMQAIKNDPPVLPLYQPYECYGMKSSLAWRPLPGHIPYVLDFRAGRVTLAAR